MKKLLFTIFTIVAFVACDKDAFEDNDITNINVLEQAEEINASVDANVDLDIDALTTRLLQLNEKAGKLPAKLRSNETAKTGGAGSHIKYISGVNSNIFYEILFSDDIAICNFASYSYLDTIYLVLNSANETEIRYTAPSGSTSILLGTITDDLSFLYAVTFSEGLSVALGDLTVTTVNGEGSADFTFGSVNIDLGCEGVAYEVTDAPFPLSGFLATKIGSYTGTFLNYAGTDRAAVIRAIETDITD